MKCEKGISTYHLCYNRKTQYLVRSTFFFSRLSLSLNIARRTAREQRSTDASIVLIFKKIWPVKTIVNRIAMYSEKCKNYRLTSQIRICLNLVMINTMEKKNKQTN